MTNGPPGSNAWQPPADSLNLTRPAADIYDPQSGARLVNPVTPPGSHGVMLLASDNVTAGLVPDVARSRAPEKRPHMRRPAAAPNTARCNSAPQVKRSAESDAALPPPQVGYYYLRLTVSNFCYSDFLDTQVEIPFPARLLRR